MSEASLGALNRRGGVPPISLTLGGVPYVNSSTRSKKALPSMSIKIKPGIGIGTEGIGIGIRIDWSGGNNHRQRQQRARRAAARARALAPVSPQETEAPEAPAEYEYENYYEYSDEEKARSRNPNQYEGSDWEKVIRGESRNEPIILRKTINKSVWQVYYNVIWRLWELLGDKDDERWKIPERPPAKSTRVKVVPRGTWIPDEWEPPLPVQEEIAREVGKVLGKVRVGSVVLGDEGVIWEPQVYPGPVPMPGGKVETKVQTRTTTKRKVIVMMPTPSEVVTARPPARIPQRSPLPEPVAAPTPPLPARVPASTMPTTNPPPWMVGLMGSIITAALIESPWDVVPEVRMQTAWPNKYPEVRLAVIPNPRPWFRDSRLRLDRKSKNEFGYLAIMKFVDRVWGDISNVMEVGEVILQNTHRKDGRAKYGYKRWDRWIQDIMKGTAEVDYTGVLIGLAANEIEDHIISWVNKKKLQSLAKAGNAEFDREARALNQLWTRVTAEGARVPRF